MKNKKQEMSTDVAKALWEEYANITKDKWIDQLYDAFEVKDWMEALELLLKFKKFKFDFNRSNK